jgi:PAS domain S-box-containing protein
MIAIVFYFRLTGSIERELLTLNGSLEQLVKGRTEALQTEVVMRRAAEDDLRKFARAVEQSPNAVFITDRDGTIQYVNPRFQEMTGYSLAEAIGQAPHIIRSPDTAPEVHKNLWDTILAGQVWRREIKDRRKDGSFYWADAVISPILGAQGVITHFVAMHTDITERKEAELATREARRRADAANRAKTEMLTNMSHELRTPLNAIIGFSSMLLEGPGMCSDIKHREYLTYINTSGSHLLDLINDILDVSAIEAGKINLQEEDIDLPAIVEASIRIVQPRAEAGGVIVTGLKPIPLPLLRADGRRLKQILLNLLSNAVKFTERGGIVSCDAYRDEDGGMVLMVTDSGIGMTEEELGIAMTAFGQVDGSLSRKHEGTGLGLPLTKGLVEAHGGEMLIKSERGKGTQVTVRFPAERVISRGKD